MRVLTTYPPAIRYLRSRGWATANILSGEVFDIPAAELFHAQARLHRKAEGACLTFRDGIGHIERCHAYPGPYEGECLETPSGGPGQARDSHLDP